MTYEEGFQNMIIDIAKLYAVHPEKVLCCLGLEGFVNTMEECYKVLVKSGLDPIEKLPEAEKLAYWNRAKEYAQEKTRRIKVSKALYILEDLTKQK